MTRLRSALWLPLFDDLADPKVVARLAADAETAGWDGCFVWDQLCWRAPVRQVADPWIALAAIATATERLRLGPMVSPLPRRRPAKVARETATLDRLCDGRLILGVGIGGDQFAGELSKSGEELDDRLRGQMLDESRAILAAAWSGERPALRRRPPAVRRSGCDLVAAGVPARRPARHGARCSPRRPSRSGR